MKRKPIEIWMHRAVWIVVGTLAHIAVTFLVGFCTLGSILGASPTHNPSEGVKLAALFFWIWNTGPMLAMKFFSVNFNNEFGALWFFLYWSLLFGIIASIVIVPSKRREDQKVKMPEPEFTKRNPPAKLPPIRK